MLTSEQIRQQFIDYFVKGHAHRFVPSSPVVPVDDPTLLFTNAGMNQFKDVFLATGTREYHRAANTQKCIRAGGKHNDLEDVGKDTYHHTFFEMLGNWSLGDYFKKEAITWAWDLLTNVWGLDKTRLHATVFGGDEHDGLEPDHEAARLWRELTDIDPDHIHFGSKKDNFWEMGDTGPCGPCSEIHIDRTPDRSGKQLVNGDDPRVMEIWNLVFIQFNRDASGKLTPLAAKHIDTGMGFERICAVLQGKDSNYDTDVFTPLFKAIAQVTNARAYTGKLDDAIDMAYRVIADHIRCLTFALTDGAVPSNDGRGYVLRRILRRAVRHGYQTLGVHEPFLHKLVPAVVEAMGKPFPELKTNPQHVMDLIRDEEVSFGRTLDRGIALFDEAAAASILNVGTKKECHFTIRSDFGRTELWRVSNQTREVIEKLAMSTIDKTFVQSELQAKPIIAGEDAFKLHDTYGFPLDLTQVMAEERGMTVDVAGFEKLMEEARELARSAGGKTQAGQMLVDIVQKENLPETQFVGYDRTDLQTTGRVALFAVSEQSYERLSDAATGQEVVLVVDSTPFYAEAGGQVGDQGEILFANGAVFRVEDTQKVGQIYFHFGRVKSGTIQAADESATPIDLRVNVDRRQRIMANHTATHVMNRALRLHVNPQADQKGSLVDDQKLRFDFSNNAAVDREAIEQVQATVMADVQADLPIHTGYAPIEEARNIHGLRAVFGEKYPPNVRVVAIGEKVENLLQNPDNPQWGGLSIEFCGGTHLPRTSQIQQFIVVSEEAVSKGVRRITALTGAAAVDAQKLGDKLLSRLDKLDPKSDSLSQAIADVTEQMAQHPVSITTKAVIQDKLAQLQQALKQQAKASDKQAQDHVVEQAKQIADTASGRVIAVAIDGADGKTLRTAMDVIRKKQPDAALLLGAAAEGKVAFVASVPKAMIDQGLKAGEWVKQAATMTGGSGGGRPDMAQAGGKDPDKLDAALEAAREFAQKLVG